MTSQVKLPSEKTITRTPFPKSKKIFVKGKQPDVNVAMREIETDDEVEVKNGTIKKEKFKLTVYDTSGPYTDPNQEINVHEGLKPLREKWIRDRNDVEELKEFTSGFANERLNDPLLSNIHFKKIRKP